MQAKIAKYGNSLTVRLPAPLARELDLREGDSVTLHRANGGILLQRPARSRLATRLATVVGREEEVPIGPLRGKELID
jgi:antitoxin component of MazEF toxin-antitoxin module